MLWCVDFNQGSPDVNYRGRRARGMNLPLQVPLTLTSHPFPAVVPFSLPQSVSQFFKVPSTSGFLFPTLLFPSLCEGSHQSCPHQTLWFKNPMPRLAIVSLSFDIQTFWLEEFQHLSRFVYIFSLSQECD